MSGCFAANETGAKVHYFIVFGLTVIVTWLLRDYAQDALKHVSQIRSCLNDQVTLDTPTRPKTVGCIGAHASGIAAQCSFSIIPSFFTSVECNCLDKFLLSLQIASMRNGVLKDLQADGSPGDCAGKGAVLRVSFGNFLFFAAHFLILLGCRKRTDARKYAHTGCLTAQTLLWAGIIGSTFVMPNHVFFVWGQVSAGFVS